MSDEMSSDRNRILVDKMLRRLRGEIVQLYGALVEAMNGFWPRGELLASLIDHFTLSELGSDVIGTVSISYPSTAEILERSSRKLRSVSSSLTSAPPDSSEDLYKYLAHWVSAIRLYLKLLEEMYDHIQAIVDDDSAQSLTSLVGMQDQISVAVYLDTDNVDRQEKVIAAVERLVYALGYGSGSDAQIETGSIFKAWWAKILKGLTSSDIQERLIRVEAYAETYLGERISVINSTEAAALKEVVTAISDIPNASLRVGSILIVKYTGRDGVVLLSRPLSLLEIRALEKYPEIQRDPLMVLELLGNALSMDHADEEPHHDQDVPPEMGA